MRLNIGRKLAISFGSLVFLLLVVAIVVFGLTSAISQNFGAVIGTAQPLAEAGYELEINADEMITGVLQFLRTGNDQYRMVVQSASQDF